MDSETKNRNLKGNWIVALTKAGSKKKHTYIETEEKLKSKLCKNRLALKYALSSLVCMSHNFKNTCEAYIKVTLSN